MTVINRALDKAYKRRADSEPAPKRKRALSASGAGSARDIGSANDDANATVSGWASKLRQPIRPLNRPAVAIEAALATAAPAIMPDALPEAAIIRVDAPQSPADSPNKAPEKIEPTLPAADGLSQSTGQSAAPSQSEQPEQWSWPPIVQRLLTCPAATELRDLAVQLRSLAADSDLRCVAFSGPGREAGRTSLVLTLASVLIADKKTRVAIVDADFIHPHAAQLISLHAAAGLEEVVNDPAADHQAAITLIAGRLAIVPLVKPIAAEAIDNRRIGTLQTFLRSLRREYDLVLIDAGPWETANLPLVLECRAVDAVVCVCRANSSHEKMPGAADFLQPGVEWLGIVETFAPMQAPVKGQVPVKDPVRRTA